MCACNIGSRVVVPNNKLFRCFSGDLEQYQCPRCINFRTHFLHLLKQHIKEDHTGQNEELQLYRCENCNFRTWSKYLFTRHKKFNVCVVNKRKFVCAFDIKRDHPYYKEDIEQVVFSVETFRCEHCSYTTGSKESLNSHECFKFQCEYCPYRARHYGVFRRHITFKHTDSTVASKKKLESVASILQAEHDHCYCKKGKFRCQYCSYKTGWKESLNSHQLIHFNFHCEYCMYTTRFKGTLKRHMKSKHSNFSTEQKFLREGCNCESDGCVASVANILQAEHDHCYYKKENIEPTSSSSAGKFKCEYCSYTTESKETLNSHKFIHFNRHCKYCPFNTHYKGSLKRYMKLTHSDFLFKRFEFQGCVYKTKLKKFHWLHLKRKHRKPLL